MMKGSIAFLAGFIALAAAQAPAATGTPQQIEAQKQARIKASMLNEDFQNYLMIICGGLAVFFICWRVTIEAIKHVRTLACLNNDSQRYFAIPSMNYANFKKHILYAPIFGKRHNREFKLTAAVNVGTLPTRFQLLFLLGYLGTNVAFCVVSIDWSGSFTTVAGAVRNRTGILSVVNMVPLFIMCTRNNPLINWLNISFDTFNLLHRWFGRIVVLEAVAHTAAWMASTVYRKGWSAVGTGIASPALLYGMIATASFIALAIQASSIFRHAAYEFFKHVHIALALLSLVGLWYHLKLETATQIKLLYVVIGIWALERATRVFKLLYRNGLGSRTLVEALPDGAARVTIDMPRPWRFKPGHHAYLYFPSIGLWTSHPFSVAWSTENLDASLMADEKLAMNRQDILAMQSTSMSFIIRARTGFTKKLIAKAENSPDGRFITKSFAEGPYGGMHMMHSYGTVMLFAGGVGITHQVPHIRDLVAGFANGTVAARKIVLVWIIQSPEHLEWIRPWMTSILAMDRRRECLKIMLFVSRPRSTKEIHSPSATVQMFPGRPDIGVLVDAEMEGQVGALGVSVCGAGSLSDDVRRVVRDRQGRGNVDFVEEAFSW